MSCSGYGRECLRSHQHARCRDAHLLPDRVPHARGRCWPRSTPMWRKWRFSLGGSRLRVFRTVTLPLAVPGLANAFLLLFAASLADFATPLILAGNAFPVLPTASLSADHRPVRPHGRRCAVAALLRAGARSSILCNAIGWRALLRHGHRQGAGANASSRAWPLACAGCCSWRCLAVTFFIAYFYALLLLCLAGRRLRRQPHAARSRTTT